MESITATPSWARWPGYWGASRGGDFSSPRFGDQQGDRWNRPSQFHEDAGHSCFPGGGPNAGIPVPPTPEITAKRQGNFAVVSYNFSDYPRDTEIAPAYLLLTVDSTSPQSPPRSRPFSLADRSGKKLLRLTPGGGPYTVRASFFTKDRFRSKVVETQLHE